MIKTLKFFILIAVSKCDQVEKKYLLGRKLENRLSQEFLDGFDTGINIRDSPEQFEQYGCPDQFVNSHEFDMFTTYALNPLKMLLSAINYQEALGPIPEGVETIETFVMSFDKYIGVFDESYQGGDFCAGLTFGMQGCKSLTEIAFNLYQRHKVNKEHQELHEALVQAGKEQPRPEYKTQIEGWYRWGVETYDKINKGTEQTAKESKVDLNYWAPEIEKMIKGLDIILFRFTECECCFTIENQFKKLGIDYATQVREFDLDKDTYGLSIKVALNSRQSSEANRSTTFPKLFIGGQEVGGCRNTLDNWQNGNLKKWLNEAGIKTKEGRKPSGK